MLVSMINEMATKQMSEEANRMAGESRGNKSNSVMDSEIPDDGSVTFNADQFLRSVEKMSKSQAEAAFADLTTAQQEEVLAEVNDIDLLIKLLPAEFQKAIESAMMSLFQMPILQELMKNA